MSFRESGVIAVDLTGVDRVLIRFGAAPHAEVMCLTFDALELPDLGGAAEQMGSAVLRLPPHDLRWVTLGVRPGAAQLDSIWYPARVRPDRPRPDADVESLTSLLGEPRTLLLRHLDVACSAGALATHLNTGPSGITYHVDALAAAGLVERQRDGRHVLVSRTRRGDGLLDLYGADTRRD